MVDKRLAEYRRLLGYLKRYRRQAIVAYGGMLIVTLLNLAVPQVIRAAIDIGLASGDISALVKASLIILAIGLVRALAGAGQRYRAHAPRRARGASSRPTPSCSALGPEQQHSARRDASVASHQHRALWPCLFGLGICEKTDFDFNAEAQRARRI